MHSPLTDPDSHQAHSRVKYKYLHVTQDMLMHSFHTLYGYRNIHTPLVIKFEKADPGNRVAESNRDHNTSRCATRFLPQVSFDLETSVSSLFGRTSLILGKTSYEMPDDVPTLSERLAKVPRLLAHYMPTW